MAYLVSTEDFGKVNLFQSYLSLIVILMGWSTSATYTIRYYKYSEEHRAELLQWILMFSFLVTLFLCLLVTLSYHQVELVTSYGLPLAYYWKMIILIYMTFVSSLFLEIYKINQDSIGYLGVSALQSILQLGGIIAVLLFFNRSFGGYIDGYFFGILMVLVAQLYLGRSYLRRRSLSFQTSLFLELLRMSTPFVAGALSSFVFSLSDRYIIKSMSGFSDVGIYGMGYKLGEIFNTFVVVSFINSLNPILFRSYATQRDEFEVKLAGSIRNFVLIAGGLLLLYSSFADVFYHIVVPVKYYAGSKVVILVSLSFFLLGISQVFGTVLLVKDKLGTTAVFSALGAVLSVVSNVFLIGRLGFVGAAISLLGVYLLQLVVYGTMAKKLMPKLAIDRKLVMVFLFMIVTLGISYLIGVLVSDIAIAAIVKVTLLLVLLSSLYITGLVKNDVDSLWRGIKGWRLSN